MAHTDVIKERIAYLKSTTIFCDVDDRSLEIIASKMQEEKPLPGQVVFSKGDPADKMYVIVEGSYKVHDGENVLNIMSDRGIFGEYALLENQRRSATVTCTREGRLLSLTVKDFFHMLEKHISITLSIMKSLTSRITSEKDRSEKLLQNILPYEIAEELKRKGSVDVRRIDCVTILFTDFSGFTRISGSMPAEELIKELNFCFTVFDEIISKYRIEKIKTIGDAYMCAGGIPVENTTHPVDVVLAALEIREFVNKRYTEKKQQGQDYWHCRIGINTGSVIAGIIGLKKFAYDIWGDTVNTASRMESCGEGGRINISKATYERISKYFDCEYRGGIEAKGKGCMDMYFVNGIRNEYCDRGNNILPNTRLLKEIGRSV